MAGLETLIGQTLDCKYQLDKRLGQGGMGAVFLATHLGTKRPVALKVIAPQFMANEEFVERFRREAEAAGRLRHPNVVNVTDFGFAQVDNEPLAYLVMEYLDGCSLGDMMKEQGALPLALVVDMVEQICLAVGNAHELGVIHRDLKPDNIWLQPDQRGGYIVKVLDFGLAKLRDPAELNLANSLAQTSSSSTNTRVGKGGNTVNAGAATRPQALDSISVEAATRVPAVITEDAQTAIFDQPQTTHINADELEAATCIQPAPLATAPELEAATRIQLATPTLNSDDDSATRIQSTSAPKEARAGIQSDEACNEDATRIQPGDANNEDATRIQPSDSLAKERSHPSHSQSRASTPKLLTNLDLDRETSAATMALTRVGSVMGTPLYMSPEQCVGDALDPRSDIYSLGVIVYQALAGAAPFTGDMNTLIHKHCDEAPPSLRDKRGDLPIAVAELVTQALAKRPEDRPVTAEAFAKAFRATAEGEAQILREAKSAYYTSQRTFFRLSVCIYLPCLIVSMGTSVLLSATLSKSPLAATAYYVGLFVLILFATRLSTASCTLVVKEVRLMPSAKVKLGVVLKTFAKRLPALISTTARSLLSILLSLIKLIVPGVSAYINSVLVPPVVIMEDQRGAAALARSRVLVSPLRPIAMALAARDFGIALASLILFPFITAVMVYIFGGTSTDALKAMMYPTNRNFVTAYCWFLLTIMHTVYGAVPVAVLYFKARQANGEAIDETAQRDWHADAQKRPAKMSRAAAFWVIAPLAMLSLMILSSLLSVGDGEDNSLTEAARKGRQSAVARLLAAGANPNEKRFGGTTVLMSAAKTGNPTMINDLLKAGARIEAKDNDGDTPLMYAAIDDRADAAKALLAAGADVNAKNNDGNTPLLAAALRGRTEVVRALLAARADTSAKNNKGKTALMLATEEGHKEVIQLLKAAGAEA
jgi:serine/threonine protein kinase